VNLCLSLHDALPIYGKFLYSAFSVFDNEDIIAYFEEMGIGLKEEDHGRMFPVSNSAKPVVDTLVNHIKDNHVEIKLGSPVKAIRSEEHTSELQSRFD